MSLETLQADIRYCDGVRELNAIRLHVGDPTIHRQLERKAEIGAQLQRLAVEHGWNVDAERWETTCEV